MYCINDQNAALQGLRTDFNITEIFISMEHCKQNEKKGD